MSRKEMSVIKVLRILAVLEGVSYILLIGICMPLKYYWCIPGPTYPVGLAHGFLFVSYCIMVLVATLKFKWNFKTFFWAGFASLLPFGTFVADKRIFKPLA
jgi:integral membrane protein